MARPPWVKSRKNDRVFSSLRKRKNFENFSIFPDAGDIEPVDVGWREACTARPPWVKSRKNDRVFSSLRKRKNFEIFSTSQASYAFAFYWCASATCNASGARGEFCRRRERTADATADRARRGWLAVGEHSLDGAPAMGQKS